VSRYKSVHRQIQFVRYTFTDGRTAFFMGPPLPQKEDGRYEIVDVAFSKPHDLPEGVAIAVRHNDVIEFIDTATLEEEPTPLTS
jgi:hypothetical protein